MFSTSAFSQSKIRIGATAGLNLAGIFNDGELSDLNPGFRGGAVFDFGIGKMFSVVPELLFSQRGWKYSGSGREETATVNYIELPINLVLKLKLASDTRLTFFPGFYAGYALSGKIKDGGSVPIGSGADEMNPLDMGVNIGLGLEIKSVIFRMQVHTGLKNLNNEPEPKMETGAFSISLGYFFN